MGLSSMVTLDNRSRKVPVKILLNRVRGGLSFSIQIFMFLYDPTRKCKEKYLNFDDLLLRVIQIVAMSLGIFQ